MALDALLEQLAGKFPNGMVSIDRRKYSCEQGIKWSAYSGQVGQWGPDADTPEEAANKLIAFAETKTVGRKAELERAIASAQAELAALEKGTL